MELKVQHTIIFSVTVLLFSSFATCDSSQYQTLIPNSLHSSQNLSWTEPEVINESESLSLQLSHIDELYPSPDASPTDRLDLSLQRDALRVRYLVSLAARHAKRTSGGFSGTVISGFYQGEGEYFIRLGVGTPAQNMYMVLDTGSDVTWLQCLPCQYCYNQSDPIFDPAKSTSYAPVPCGSPVCHKLGSRCLEVAPHNKTCFYQKNYIDRSSTSGDFSTETLTFQGARVDHIAFGCGYVNIGRFNGSAGLFGLGRGEFSFPSQTKNLYNGKFSYCFGDRFTRGSSSNSQSNIVFGDAAIPKNAVFTPMVTNPKPSTFYYVKLLGISVGGSRVRGITESMFEMDAVTGDGGVIIDSGSTFTLLKHSAYVALRDAFRREMGNVKRVRTKYRFETCYDFYGVNMIKVVPSVVFHFAGVDVSLPVKNYLVLTGENAPYCFAFADSGGNLSIYGNIQQQGFRIAYDSVGSRVGFLPHSC